MNNINIFAIVNQKGGVGKTTTTINLGTAMAAIGKKVLLVDLDPQGNLSTGLGCGLDKRAPSTYDLVLSDEVNIEDTIRESVIPSLSLVPSEIDLSGIEIELANDTTRNVKLSKKMTKLNNKYDYIFIDCPPSLGILTLNALVASGSVLVPLQCEFFALEGLAQLIKTIEIVKTNLNPSLLIEGVILTMFDKRNNLSVDVANDAKKHLGNRVFKTIIPRNIRLSEAPSHGLPAIVYDQNCRGSQSYIKLAKELLTRLNDRNRR